MRRRVTESGSNKSYTAARISAKTTVDNRSKAAFNVLNSHLNPSTAPEKIPPINLVINKANHPYIVSHKLLKDSSHFKPITYNINSYVYSVPVSYIEHYRKIISNL